MPLSSGAESDVPPTWPLVTPPLLSRVEMNLTPVCGSATAEMSGTTRPAHGAAPLTCPMFCQLGRATTFEHQLPAADQVVAVDRLEGSLVEYSDVPPTETTYWLSDGKPDIVVPKSPVEK